MTNYSIVGINGSQYKIWKHLRQLVNKYLVIFNETIIKRLGITENTTVFLEHVIIQHNIFLIRIKKILKRHQKKFIEKINNKMMFDQNRIVLNISSYHRPDGSTKYNNIYFERLKFFYEDAKALKKLEDDLFKGLIKIINDLPNVNIHENLPRIVLKPIPSFSDYIYDIPDKLNAKLDQLPEPILYNLTHNLIDRLHEYLIQNEKILYQYFVDEVRDDWLLKWRFI
jgi:hypothetical protein